MHGNEMKKSRIGFAVICLLGLAVQVLQSQALHPLPLEDALSAREFGEFSPIEFSPDSKLLAYTVEENRKTVASPPGGVLGAATETNIYVLDIKTGHTTKLTDGDGDNRLPTWSPDGRYLAFLSNRGEGAHFRLWVWDTAKHVLRKVWGGEAIGNEVEWINDSQHLLVTSVPGVVTPEENTPSTAGDQDQARTSVPGSTVLVFKPGTSPNDGRAGTSDPWNLDDLLCDLALVDISSGKANLIIRRQRISKYSLSPDGTHVAYTSPRGFEDAGSQQILFDLDILDLNTNNQRIVAAGVALALDGAQFSWSPDGADLSYQTMVLPKGGKDIYVVNVRSEHLENTTSFPEPASSFWQEMPVWGPRRRTIYFIRNGALWQVSPEESKPREIASVPGHQLVQLVSKGSGELWAPDGGDYAVALTRDETDKRDGFYKIDLIRGEVTKLLEGTQCYTCSMRGQLVSVAPNGQSIAYLAEDPEHGADLWISDSSFSNPRQLTDINSNFAKYRMGAARLIEWYSMDGERLKGSLLLPAGYQEGKRYPLIVYVYGGATLSNSLDRFGLVGNGPLNMQLLATRGYVVLLPDAPQHLGTPLLDLAKTVLPGVNKVIELGIADPDRLGIMGHSFGGYSTLALIVQTNRFKAAMDIDGMGDLVAAYGAMNRDGTAFETAFLERGNGLLGGTPWQYRERYIENSPVFYLDRLQTPLLIIHGSEDATVPPFLDAEVFVGLRRLGREVELAEYMGEGHSPLYWSYANQLDFCTRVIAWFDDLLKKRN
jgi:dipeptidyl aminopeptidase/acylaminoacyl peptidase